MDIGHSVYMTTSSVLRLEDDYPKGQDQTCFLLPPRILDPSSSFPVMEQDGDARLETEKVGQKEKNLRVFRSLSHKLCLDQIQVQTSSIR